MNDNLNDFSQFSVPDGPAIDVLAPGTAHHAAVLNYLQTRLKSSEDEMTKFYDRWNTAEKRVQAYVKLSSVEEALKQGNENGLPAKVTSITIPYTFATIQTIVTYLVQTFCGRKPMFQIGANKKEEVQGARMMETYLQYNADHTRLVKHLFQFFNDGELYGLQVLRTQWKTKKEMRTVWVNKPRSFLGIEFGAPVAQKIKQLRTVFQGTDVISIDPFMFFPDPRVPMAEVNTRGEFVFWRVFDGKHMLKLAENDGMLKYVDYVGSQQADRTTGSSNRNLRSRGEAHPGQRESTLNRNIGDYVQIDQGSVTIIPYNLRLGASTRPEKWLFTIGNGNQILQAEPLDADHGKHPVVVGEPYSMGYGFGQCGISDYLGPLQDTISWFINSHIHNVRSALNNMWIVDPSMVEMSDLRNPEPGKMIRLKRTAYGRDVRMAVNQLPVQDVTGSHVNDLNLFMKMGDALSAVTDNIRGQQDSGGRKTATEARTSLEAAASRLAAHARFISAQSIVDLTEQLCLNAQQNLEDEFYLQVVGAEGLTTPVHIKPSQLVGDFYYPINDGTLPLDRVAMLEVWKEIFLTTAQDPLLRQQFNVVNLFEWVAELGGAKDLSRFKVDVAPNNNAIQQGNAVPVQDAIKMLGGG